PLRVGDAAPPRRILDAVAPPRAALPADRASLAERDPRGVGTALRRARGVARDGGGAVTTARVAVHDAPGRRLAALARRLLPLARGGRVRSGTRPPAAAGPRRARVPLRARGTCWEAAARV